MTKLEQINLSNAIDFLAASIDELKIVWNDYLTQEYDDKEDLADRFFFEDMRKLSAYVVEKYKQGKTENFENFFNALEEIFTDLDSNTCSCVSAGLIEHIQAYSNIDFYTGFNKWLKPKTKEWWDDAIEYWNKDLSVVRNHLTDQEIIANKESIYLCAKAFREDASTLMLQLSKKFDFNLNDCGAWPIPVYKTNYKNKGTLNAGWTFYLHGSHCRFDNLKTGQAIEVKYTEKPEFGCLEGFFFYNYMQTTERFKDLASWFINYVNVYHALEVLAEAGTLTKKPSIGSGSYVVAL